MIDNDKHYWINEPVFLKFKDRFDFSRFERVRELKKMFLNDARVFLLTSSLCFRKKNHGPEKGFTQRTFKHRIF